MLFFLRLLAQTDDIIPDVPVDVIVDTVNRIGSVSFPVQISAIITLFIAFFIVISVFEWRKMNSESALRRALEKQAFDANEDRKKTDLELDKERDKRRLVEDELDLIRRKMRDNQATLAKYQSYVSKVSSLQDEGNSQLALDLTIPFPENWFDELNPPDEALSELEPPDVSEGV